VTDVIDLERTEAAAGVVDEPAGSAALLLDSRAAERPLPRRVTDRPAKKADAYLPQLDGVRAFAVLLVVVQHWVANPRGWGAPFGFIGVTMFFVLSGYLISRILFAAKERQDRRGVSIGQSLKTFYARRFLRIFPIYYLTVLVLWIVNDVHARPALPWLLTYTTNFYFLNGGARTTIGHLWTLAIEEQYYIVYPFMVLFFTARQRWIALWAMCGVALASRIFVDRYGVPGLTEGPVDARFNKFFTLGNFDSFAMGGMLAHWELSRGKESVQAFFRKWQTGALAAGITLLFAVLGILLGDRGSGRVIWFRTIISVASLYVVGLALLESKLIGKVLANRGLVYIGKISYGVYLYHLYAHRFVALFYPDAEKLPYLVLLALYSAATMIVATASWYLFEKPINGLKSRFRY
jgi:peptidoglycan/LPS O-acetylase OafA/YrhL